MISLRESLLKISEPKPGKSTLVFPHGFHSTPKSLKAAMHAMNPPMIGQWLFAGQSVFENKVWTEECQGLTSDGNYWYVVSNNEQDPNCNYDEFGEPIDVLNYEHKGIYKFTLDFQPLGFLQYTQANHVGAPCYHHCHLAVLAN